MKNFFVKSIIDWIIGWSIGAALYLMFYIPWIFIHKAITMNK